MVWIPWTPIRFELSASVETLQSLCLSSSHMKSAFSNMVPRLTKPRYLRVISGFEKI